MEMETEKERELWKLAKKRVGFKRHLATYIVINSFLWLMWYFTDYNDGEIGVPWPIFPMLGWGVGVMFSFLGAYVFNNHDSVEKEYEKLKGQ
jgi:hypothetical protein